MSIRIMSQRCIHCYKTYTYNPSTGDFGRICKYCMKPQRAVIPVIITKKKGSYL